MDENSIERQFIFKEAEFEVDAFVPANFVAKYRKVNSLESLKEQLIQYSNTLKDQLYNIINRDYKDFITISTKLDGVDTRANLLQKPLLGLREDISALHEGVVTGLQAIQEKVKHRLEVSRRRQLLQSLLRCMDRLDVAAAILTSCSSAGSAGSASSSGAAEAAGAQGGLGDLLLQRGSNPIPTFTSTAPSRASPRSRLLRALDRKLGARAAVGPGGAAARLVLERDVFVCSELERAAFCLASVETAMGELQQQCRQQEEGAEGQGCEESKGEPSPSSEAGHVVLALMRSRSGLLSLFRTLQAQAAALRQGLVARLQSQLTPLLAHAIGATGCEGAERAESLSATGSDISSSGGCCKSSLALRQRCVAHCLRALCALGSPAVAEDLLRTALVGPFVRSQLTVGRVDGRGGRGSYSGLEDALQSVLDGLMLTPLPAPSPSDSRGAPTFLKSCLEVGETVLAYCAHSGGGDSDLDSELPGDSAAPGGGPSRQGRALDLVVHGLWLPVAEVLQERFADMFSVGIPATQSLCYRTARQFLGKLQAVCGPQHAPAVARRLQQHPLVSAFFGQWRLDLYYQLRCKEVFGRLDRVCDAALRQGLAAPQRLLGETYSAAQPDGPHATLRPEVEAQLARCGGGVGGGSVPSAAFTATALELRACLHPSVFLEPLAGKFLALILRTLMRLEAHVAVVGNVCTPSFASREELEQLRALALYSGAPSKTAIAVASTGEAGNNPCSATPAGKRGASSSTPTVAAVTPGAAPKGEAGTASSAGPLPTLGLDELALLAGDVLCLERWLAAEYGTAAASALVLRAMPAAACWGAGTGGGAGSVDLRAVDAVRGALQKHADRLRGAREAVWARAGSTLGAECKKALGAVKTAVVSRYRMTNKPAPEVASPYVETILAPLRKFLGQHGALVERLTGAGAATNAGMEAGGGDGKGLVVGLRAWLGVLLEDISASFAEQVAALIDTVKQMDSTLQRRSKLQQQQGTAAGPSATLTDSEKIALQMKLDIEAFGRELQSLGLDLSSLSAFCALRELSFDAA